jgi:hypothetical protein
MALVKSVGFRWFVLAVGSAMTIGCTGDKDTASSGTLPGLDSALTGDGGNLDTGFSFQADTFDAGALDQVPNNTLQIQHAGSWSLSPLGGPYRAAVGELYVDEYIDGQEDMPWCWVIYSMTGEVVDDARADSCPTCDFVVEIQFYVNQDGGFKPEDGAEPIDTGGNYDEDDVIETNGIADCMSPELPEDGDRWLMGWAGDEETIYMEYFGSGIWLPWYSGELEFDTLDFSWVDEFGFVVPPEEEED